MLRFSIKTNLEISMAKKSCKMLVPLNISLISKSKVCSVSTHLFPEKQMIVFAVTTIPNFWGTSMWARSTAWNCDNRPCSILIFTVANTFNREDFIDESTNCE